MKIALILALLVAVVVLPLQVSAQVLEPYENNALSAQAVSSTNDQQQWLRGMWNNTSGLQSKVSALPSEAVSSVAMPVLFGVGLKNISPNFGDPRSGGRKHEGEDIMAVKGTPIISPTNAVVLRTGVGSGEGNYVYTANPGGETFVYMHLDRIGEGVETGAVLQTGSLIGYVGNTGNASGGAAHLHFEIHDSDGKPTDPFVRLTSELSLEQKINYLSAIFNQASDSGVFAQFLVTNFRKTFVDAQVQNIILPNAIMNLLAPGSTSTSIVSANTATTINATVKTVSSNKILKLSRDLSKNMTGEDVRTLQKLLNANGYVIAKTGVGSIGKETTYFGAATQAAVKRFQIDYSIKPAYGYVGALTRAAFISSLNF